MKKKDIAKAESAPTKENPEWTADRIDKAIRFSALPLSLQQKLTRKPRGLQKAPKKVPVSIRLSPDVITALRATGPGWQARADEILRNHI
jgi:uncharacterized protein (DUF4415 family)